MMCKGYDEELNVTWAIDETKRETFDESPPGTALCGSATIGICKCRAYGVFNCPLKLDA